MFVTKTSYVIFRVKPGEPDEASLVLVGQCDHLTDAEAIARENVEAGHSCVIMKVVPVSVHAGRRADLVPAIIAEPIN